MVSEQSSSHENSIPTSGNTTNLVTSPPSPTNVSLIALNISAQINEKLTPSTFSQWRAQFEALLIGYNLFDYIAGTNSLPPPSDSSTSSLQSLHWLRQDKLILSAILASTTPTITPFLSVAKTSEEAWRKLHTLSASRLLAYLPKPFRCQISLIDHPVADDDLTLYILNGLGSDFREIAAPIRAREKSLTFEELHDLIIGHDAYLRRLDTITQQLVASANYSNQRSIGGHSFRGNSKTGSGRNGGFSCPDSNPSASRSSSGSNNSKRFHGQRKYAPKCQIYDEFGHIVKACSRASFMPLQQPSPELLEGAPIPTASPGNCSPSSSSLLRDLHSPHPSSASSRSPVHLHSHSTPHTDHASQSLDVPDANNCPPPLPPSHWTHNMTTRVMCTSHSNSGSVIALYLDSIVSEPMMVNSAVLSPLFHVKSLMYLDIGENNFHGEIPRKGFANLTKLVYLEMMFNNFTGTIPSQIFHLKNLQYLDLSGNALSGKISQEVFSLQNLRILRLAGNFLEDCIPEEIGNLKKLQELTLYHNKFSGGIPPSISSLKELEDLDLYDDLLSKEISVEIGDLTNLTRLDLSDNKLIGGIPSSIQKLRKLETFKLQSNLLSGETPSWLFDIQSLKYLFIGGNKLTWNSSAKIVPKCMLSQLSLKSCGLAGLIPDWLSTQKSLFSLDLSANKLEGPFPLWLAEMELSIISLSHNDLSGSLPSRLFQFQSLVALCLAGNNFSGELPQNIGDDAKLRSAPVFAPEGNLAVIDFSDNELFGEIPVTFSKNTVILSLGNNHFSGNLPQNLTNLSKLLQLDLHDNQITGKLPSFLFQMYTLQDLILRNNSLYGSIPNEISNLINLRILDVSCNNRTGEIPAKIGYLVGMTETSNTLPLIFSNLPSVFELLHLNDMIVIWKKSKRGLSKQNIGLYSLLDLSKNKFSGNIPSSLGSLIALKIPEALSKLQQVTTFDVSNNKLVGKIPVGAQMDTMIYPNSYANNGGLCAPPPTVRREG
ncbi:hypothetical protein Pint_31459 [Pistacia integerrima]|uniref:Uncharacterized protein n=1 Tax=Pistacia integerrima TaxID=434235 RepID=A0ACC0XSS6_9ROSI|nr:hypothetical protein Pint_31459 [Pistacia integerrima]